MKIPLEYQKLFKDIAKLLKQFNIDNGYCTDKQNQSIIYSFNGNIVANIPNVSNMSFGWNNGRHGDTSNKIEMNASLYVRTTIDE